MEISKETEHILLKKALLLSTLTIVYNLIEGLVSVYFGITDETLVLFGFGADSFIETISATGIAVMIWRMQTNPDSNKSRFEKRALQITGFCFYLLSALLVYQIVVNELAGHKPESAWAGVIISVLSIIFMYFLIRAKRKVGEALDSKPILADVNCGKVCIYMSVVLLVSTLLYGITGIGHIDSLGALVLVWFSFKEGRESFEKSKGKNCECECNC